LDALATLVLLGLGVLTRCAYLTYPREVVFDEYHFGKFINGYITGMRSPPIFSSRLAATAGAEHCELCISPLFCT